MFAFSGIGLDLEGSVVNAQILFACYFFPSLHGCTLLERILEMASNFEIWVLGLVNFVSVN